MAEERKKQFTITLSRTLLAFFLFPVFSFIVAIGGMGIFVLTDEDGTGAISSSVIGPVIRGMTQWNTFCLPLLLNAGLIGAWP